MAVVAVADLFGISGGRSELVAALQRAQREAITHPGASDTRSPPRSTTPTSSS
jgi:hypothetical protein